MEVQTEQHYHNLLIAYLVLHKHGTDIDPLDMRAQMGRGGVAVGWDVHCNILAYQVNSILNENQDNICIVCL